MGRLRRHPRATEGDSAVALNGTTVKTLVEAIKLFGGIAGLVTAAFLVWDRWARGRPLAWVTARKFGANPLEYIRLKNPGYGDVFVLGVRAYPRVYDVAKDRSVRATITATALKWDVRVLLRQNEEWDLPIFPNLPTDAASRRVCFLVFWRKTSSTWLPQVPVVIMTSTGYIERIAAAAPKQD